MLVDGRRRDVAVKVRHPGVALRIAQDFALLKPLAALASQVHRSFPCVVGLSAGYGVFVDGNGLLLFVGSLPEASMTVAVWSCWVTHLLRLVSLQVVCKLIRTPV